MSRYLFLKSVHVFWALITVSSSGRRTKSFYFLQESVLGPKLLLVMGCVKLGVINLRFVHPQKAAEHKLITQFHATHVK